MRSVLAILLIAVTPTLNAGPASPAPKLNSAFAEAVIDAASAVSQAELKLGNQARAQSINHAHLGKRDVWIVVLANQGVRVRESVDEVTGEVSPPTRVLDVAARGEEPPVLPPVLSLGNAITRAERALHARVLSASLEAEDQVAHYDIELITHGKHISIEMDADSGRIQPERADENDDDERHSARH